jgi:hypothetical protein
MINQIANFIFLEYKDNIQIGDKSPDIYWDMFQKNCLKKRKKKYLKNMIYLKTFGN